MGARAVSLCGLFRLVLCRGAASGAGNRCGSAASLPGAGRLSLLTDARPRPSTTSQVPHCPLLPTTCCRGRGKSLERKEHRGGGSRGRPCRLRAPVGTVTGRPPPPFPVSHAAGDRNRGACRGPFLSKKKSLNQNKPVAPSPRWHRCAPRAGEARRPPSDGA